MSLESKREPFRLRPIWLVPGLSLRVTIKPNAVRRDVRYSTKGIRRALKLAADTSIGGGDVATTIALLVDRIVSADMASVMRLSLPD